MHIHVPDQSEYKPIDFIRGMGTVTRVAIENLMDQQAQNDGCSGSGNYNLAPVEPGQVAAIVVAPGDGLARVSQALVRLRLLRAGRQ